MIDFEFIISADFCPVNNNCKISENELRFYLESSEPKKVQLVRGELKMKQTFDYGVNRVLEPQHVLPTSAWKLDNSRKIQPFEMRIALKKIQIEGTSFKQICMEANDNDERVKQKIVDIAIRRGKLHNPVTDTGGLLYGEVQEVGEEYRKATDLDLKPGDEVICNASLTSIPLYISGVKSIERAFCQADVEGYAIVYPLIPIIRKPQDAPMNLMLYALNESGTLLKISSTAVGKKKFLVVGNNLLTNVFYGYAIRKVAREDAEILCLLDQKSDAMLQGSSIERLLDMVFTEVRYVDILKPLECLNEIGSKVPFDLSVNCADIPGAETINILATRSGGTVVFANLINNYNIALYITESVSKRLDIRCADGYVESYDSFDLELVRDLAPYIERAIELNVPLNDDPSYPIGRKSRLREASGQRQTMLEDFVCESSAMAEVLDEMFTVAKYDCNVLITGETGVGKEKVANIIYKNSGRKMQPFIKVNCASISQERIEQEFFGYELPPEAPDKQPVVHKGYFEMADNGVVFLDDVGELSPDMQAKLLRVIQDGECFRVGGNQPIKVNVRVLSATSRDLEQRIEEGKFRRDLYYRLNVVRIHVPSLRERSSDIPALVDHFLRKYGERFEMKRVIDRDAVEYLKQSKWEGNIRELENVVQRLMISAGREHITQIDVMKELHGDIFDSGIDMKNGDYPEGQVMDLEMMVQNFERNILKHACEQYGSTRKIAKAVGISQTQLVRKKKKYNL